MNEHFQRDTDILKFNNIKKQILQLYLIVHTITTGEYKQACILINGINLLLLPIFSIDLNISLPSQLYNSLSLQLQYQHILTQLYQLINIRPKHQNNYIQKIYKKIKDLLQKVYQINSKYIENQQQQYWEYAEMLKIRIFTTILLIGVKFGQIVKVNQWVYKLIDRLKQFPEYLPQVMGRLTGCKNPKQFSKNFTSQQILSSATKSLPQKATIIDIASSFFIIAGQLQKGIKLKQLAVKLWDQADSLSSFTICKQQLQQLQNNTDGQYCMWLKKCNFIVEKVYDGMDEKIINKYIDNNNSSNMNMHYIILKSIKNHVKSIQLLDDRLQKIQQDQNKKKNGFFNKIFSSSKSKSSSSKLQKTILKSQNLSQYYQRCEQFIELYEKSVNEQITQLLLKSKYVFQQKTRILSKLKYIIKHFALNQREVFQLFKICNDNKIQQQIRLRKQVKKQQQIKQIYVNNRGINKSSIIMKSDKKSNLSYSDKKFISLIKSKSKNKDQKSQYSYKSKQ